MRHFTLRPAVNGYVLSRDGESWSKAFKTLQEALRFAEVQAKGTQAILIVENEQGQRRLELEL